MTSEAEFKQLEKYLKQYNALLDKIHNEKTKAELLHVKIEKVRAKIKKRKAYKNW